MKTMPAGKFKANCLAIMDQVEAKREPVLITKHGKPVAVLNPLDDSDDPIFDLLKGQVILHDDLIKPAVPLEDWDMLK